MQANKAFVLATITTMLCAATAMADTYVSNGTGGGDWSSTATWFGTPATPPGNGDDVTIASGDVVTIDVADPRPDSLVIQGGGATLKFDQADSDREFSVEDPDGLTINAGGIFEVSRDFTNSPERSRALVFDVATSTPHHTIDGQIQLVGPKSFLDVETDVTLNAGASGDRAVVLQNAGASIRIKADETLTLGSSASIEGEGQIVRLSGATDANFQNNGTLHANVPSADLLLNSFVALAGDGLWTVSNGATMTFNEPTDDLTGDFEPADATFVINANVETTGDVVNCGGSGTVFDVAAATCFRYDNGSPQSLCGAEAARDTFTCGDIP